MEIRKDIIRSKEWMKPVFGWPVVLLLFGGLYWAAVNTGFDDPARWPELVDRLREQADRELPPVLIGGFMALVFVFIVIKLVVDTVSIIRFGLTSLRLDPNPGSIGGHLGGVFRLGYSLKPGDSVKVTAVCWRHYVRRSRGKSETTRERYWSEEVMPEVLQQFGDLQVRFTIDLPESLPPTGESGDDTFKWEVILRVDRRGRDIVRAFNVPVEKHSSPRHAAQVMRRDVQQAQGDIPGMAVSDASGQLDIRGLPGRNMSLHMTFLVMGLVSGGVGMFLGVGVAYENLQELLAGPGSILGSLVSGMFAVIPGIIAIGFTGVGLLMLVGGWSGLRNRREMQLANGRLSTRNRGGATELTLDQVRGFELSETGSVGTNTIHDIHAVTKNDERVAVVEGIPGKIAARQLVALLEKHAGLEVSDVGRNSRRARRLQKRIEKDTAGGS